MVRRSVVGKYCTMPRGQNRAAKGSTLLRRRSTLPINSMLDAQFVVHTNGDFTEHKSCTQMLLLHERLLFEDFVACRRPPPPVSEDHPSSSPLLSDPSPPLGSPLLHPSVPLSLSNPTEQFRGFQQQKRRTRNLSYELSVQCTYSRLVSRGLLLTLLILLDFAVFGR